MPRMSKRRKEEWALFLNDRNRITYNELCRKCVHDCIIPPCSKALFCNFKIFSDPFLTQNGTGAGRAGRKQRKIRRVNGGKKHKSEPKQLRFALETTYGPEGRGFESLTACQFQEPGNRNGFPALSMCCRILN